MDGLFISIGEDAASDAWGFVGTVKVGEIEAYRTLEAFATPALAREAAQLLMAEVLGEILAGREWRRVRDDKGHIPTRQDFTFSALKVDPDQIRADDADERPVG